MQTSDDLGAAWQPKRPRRVRRARRPLRVIAGTAPANEQRILNAEHTGAVRHDDLRAIGDEDAGVGDRGLRDHLRRRQTALRLPSENRPVEWAGDERAAKIVKRPVCRGDRRSGRNRRRDAEPVAADAVAAVTVALASIIRAGRDVVKQPRRTGVHGARLV